MQVFQTAGVPPSSGKSIFAIIGCTQNNSDALANNVTNAANEAAAGADIRMRQRKVGIDRDRTLKKRQRT